MINRKQRAALRSMANGIDPILWIGKGGINENMAEQVSLALEARELIKLAVLETADVTAREACETLAQATGAEPVQCIGRKFVLYRESATLNPEKRIKI